MAIKSCGYRPLVSQDIRKELIAGGWRTPDTYCGDFSPIGKISAVYMFILIDRWTFKKSIIAYIGMSQNLKNRLAAHEMNDILDIPEYRVMRWFKPVAASDLRRVEGLYIAEYDPPWNISGRTRGITFQ